MAGCGGGSATDTRDQATIGAANQYQKLSDAHETAMGRANDQLKTVKSFDDKVAGFFQIELDAEKAFDASLQNIAFPDPVQADGKIMLQAGQQLETALPVLIVEAQVGNLTANSDDMKQWGIGIDTRSSSASLAMAIGRSSFSCTARGRPGSPLGPATGKNPSGPSSGLAYFGAPVVCEKPSAF